MANLPALNLNLLSGSLDKDMQQPAAKFATQRSHRKSTRKQTKRTNESYESAGPILETYDEENDCFDTPPRMPQVA